VDARFTILICSCFFCGTVLHRQMIVVVLLGLAPTRVLTSRNQPIRCVCVKSKYGSGIGTKRYIRHDDSCVGRGRASTGAITLHTRLRSL